MEQLGTLISVSIGLVGLIAGYFLGYRSGAVAGELAALKSMRRHDRHESRSRAPRELGDGQ